MYFPPCLLFPDGHFETTFPTSTSTTPRLSTTSPLSPARPRIAVHAQSITGGEEFVFVADSAHSTGYEPKVMLIASLEELETMDASEIYSKRLNAKEVIFPKQGEFIFPIADGRIKTPGGDQELRTSTLVRHRPIQGESHIDFLGESEESLPQPHDSLPDAGEAINDFWSMSGSFIYCHHVEPRVKLYSPREESFPTPLKYIDVTRTTHTNVEVKQEKRIDDYWNIVSMGLETCLILGQVSHNLLYWKKNLLTDTCGPGRD